MKRIYEFLVWDNCNNNCQFCWQRENPRLYTKQQREMILDEVINFIKSPDYINGSHILVCGGEVFDKPSDFEKLSQFFKIIVDYMKEDIIDLLYINTNLIYSNMSGVLDMLQQVDSANMINRVRFTTSYDVLGRFKTESDRQLMLYNLKLISDCYPTIHTVVNIILTKQACNEILNDTLNIRQIMSKYNCWVNLIPYIVLDSKLTASKSLIFRTLNKVNTQCPGYLEKYVPNMCIKQEKWLYMYKDNKFQFCSCENSSDCGHSINFKKYSTDGTCFCCDLEGLFG